MTSFIRGKDKTPPAPPKPAAPPAPAPAPPVTPPAPAPEPKHADTTPDAAVNWGTVKAATNPDRKFGRKAAGVDVTATPFPGWYAQSKSNGQWMDVGPLANDDQVKQAARLIRAAARAVDGGVQVKTNLDSKIPNMDRLLVSFLATEKKAYTPGKPRKPRQNKDETHSEYGKRIAEFTKAAEAWNKEHPDDTVTLPTSTEPGQPSVK